MLQQKNQNDSLDKLIDLALKFEAVNTLLRPKVIPVKNDNKGPNNISAMNSEYRERYLPPRNTQQNYYPRYRPYDRTRPMFAGERRFNQRNEYQTEQ